MSEGHQGLRILSPCILGQNNPGSSGFVSRSCLISSTQLLPTSQEERTPENLTTHPVPDQPCGQGLPEPNSSMKAKKVSVVGLVEAGWGMNSES